MRIDKLCEALRETTEVITVAVVFDLLFIFILDMAARVKGGWVYMFSSSGVHGESAIPLVLIVNGFASYRIYLHYNGKS